MTSAPVIPVVRLKPMEMMRQSGPVRIHHLMGMFSAHPVVELHVGPYKMVVVTEPDHVKHVLQDRHTNFAKSSTYDQIKLFLGNGLLTSEGDFWKRQRRLAQPAFHKEQLANLTQVMVSETQRALDRMAAQMAAGEVTDLSREMMRVTLSVVGRALFSTDLDEEAGEVSVALTTVLQETNRRIMSPIRLPLGIPTPRNRRFKRALAVLDAHVARIIAERRASHEPGQDLLGMFLSVKDAETGEQMTDLQLRDEVMTMVLAGHETTANALGWALSLLCRFPDAQRRIRAEVAEVLGDRDPVAADVPKLAYTGRVISEAMRLYPPIWGIERQSVAADQIGPYPIPAGTRVAVNLYALHHNPQHWDNPDGFDPDRFLPERAKTRHRYAYLPFAVGPRQCIGNNFALMEASVVLAMLLRRFEVALLPGALLDPEMVLTFRPRFGLPAHLRSANTPPPSTAEGKPAAA